jgi:hypothetical protein
LIDSTPPIVVTRNLRKNDKKDNLQELSTVIEFTISSFASSDEATITRMNRSVGKASEASKHIRPPPSAAAVAPARDAVGVAVGVIPSVSTVLTTWEPLLGKVKSFTEIMDKFAEV